MNAFPTAVAVSILSLATGGALAQDAARGYPNKPIRLIVAQTAGGNADFVARTYGQKLGERLGQQVVVDNRPGGGGVIATELVARAAADGYTLLLGPTSHAINPTLIAKLPYDTARDLAPVSLLGRSPNLLVVGMALPAKNVQELIALAKAQPGKLYFSSSGVASSPQFAGEHFKQVAGVNIQHVAYKGGPAAIVAVVSGEVALSFGSMATTLPLVRSGKLRALGVTSLNRFSGLPDVPTVAEAGLPGFETTVWQALLAPAKTPPAIINRLYTEIAAIAKLPEVRDRMAVDGTEAVGSTPKELEQHVARELEKFARIARAAGIKPE